MGIQGAGPGIPETALPMGITSPQCPLVISVPTISHFLQLNLGLFLLPFQPLSFQLRLFLPVVGDLFLALF